MLTELAETSGVRLLLAQPGGKGGLLHRQGGNRRPRWHMLAKEIEVTTPAELSSFCVEARTNVL
jgi:hypothetical protein